MGLGAKKPTTYRKQNWFHSGHHVIVSKKLYHILKKINAKRPPPRPKRQEGVSAAWVEIDLLDLVPTPLKTGSARLRAAGCSFDWEHVVQLKSGSSATATLSAVAGGRPAGKAVLASCTTTERAQRPATCGAN